MKKTSESSKFPTFRGQMEKRTSAFDPLLSTSKPDTGQDLSVEFIGGQMSSTQVEVAKRIQNRLRMRKAAGSQKRIYRDPVERGETCDKIQDSCEADPSEDFESKVEHLWENSEDVGNMVNSLSSFIEPHELKRRLLKESGIIQCQLLGQNMQNLILVRLKKLGELAKSQQKCQQRVNNMEKMLEERMKKLGNILRSR